MWELIPRSDRPEAQVLLTLPNGEQEYVDGFLYQEFRQATAEAGATLSPAGPPHTRYRYLPRLAGTHSWQLRTPAGGILEQGAFVADPAPRSPHRPLVAPLLPPSPPHLLTSSLAGDNLTTLHAIASEPGTISQQDLGILLVLDTTLTAIVLPNSEPDLARAWLLDAALRTAEPRGVGVVLRLPPPPGPERAQLHAALHYYICRYAAMRALAAWEIPAGGDRGEAAARFLQSYDPHHPVRLAGEAK